MMDINIVTKPDCKYCTILKGKLANTDLEIEYINAYDDEHIEYLNLIRDAGLTFPCIFVDGQYFANSSSDKTVNKLIALQKNNDTITVIKRDGTKEKFSDQKLLKWAKYADKHGANWIHVASETLARLSSHEITTKDIHKTMIAVCLDKEERSYARVASRLIFATIRKAMKNELGFADKVAFKDLFDKYHELGYWKIETPYNPEWEAIYTEMQKQHFDNSQLQQFCDKYALCNSERDAIETPHIALLGIAIAIHGNNLNMVKRFAMATVQGKINLPTPALNGIRNGDWNVISCSVIEGGDTVESIAVANHLSMMMTAKKAGIGISMATRSKGDSVKNGTVKHLGKQPLYHMVEKSVKSFTQQSRGGSATMTFKYNDPDVSEIILGKSLKAPENVRIDKIDYSMSYDNEFIRLVKCDGDVPLVSITEGIVGYKKAREILKEFLIVRNDTGRLYCTNLDTVNKHTPFKENIIQSNLCLEVSLPTKAYPSMADLCADVSEGEVAFCTLCALNYRVITNDVDLEDVAEIAVLTLNILMDRVEMFAPSLKHNLMRRSSLGIGIMGLADYLGINSRYYSEHEIIEELAERHYFYLLKASQAMVTKYNYLPIKQKDIDYNWLPIDTKSTAKAPLLDWESLRGKPRANSVLVAHMPTESSAIFSGGRGGLYPSRIKNGTIRRQSRHGSIVEFIPNYITETAWETSTTVMQNMYASVQAYTDQAISADYYSVPALYENNKISLKRLMIEFVRASELGIKNTYYLNTADGSGKQVERKETCESCSV